MLTSLRIQNIAIAENLEIELDPGLNILTGETGAGKSIILKSIELLSGRKSSTNVIRAGVDKAIIEGMFSLSPETYELLIHEFEELEAVVDDKEELLIRRVFDKSGRSKFYINGAIFNQGTISRIAPYLVEITGQHDQQHLKESSYHREVLDNFGTEQPLIDLVKTAYGTYKSKKDFLTRLINSKEEMLFKLERLKFEATELRKVNLLKGEKEQLENEVERVKHFDRIQTGLDEAIVLLEDKNSNSKSTSIYSKISKICSLIEPLARFDSELNNSVETAQQALTCISELSTQLNENLRNLDFDSIKFEKDQTRLSDIKKIERKYLRSGDELLEYLSKIEKEIGELEGSSLDEKKIEQEVSLLLNELQKCNTALTASRIKSAKHLTAIVLKELKELNLPKARFEIKVESAEPTAIGADKIVFYFSANPGEPLHPLEQVASGGELSRVQLILKSLSHSNQNKNLLVFDEIDAGISGAISQSVGEKLLKLSKSSQVIAITHSAQIAALADRHILVEKEIKNDRTYSKASSLSEDRRIEVIASILAGKNVSDDFMKSAEKLLEIRKEKDI